MRCPKLRLDIYAIPLKTDFGPAGVIARFLNRKGREREESPDTTRQHAMRKHGERGASDVHRQCHRK